MSDIVHVPAGEIVSKQTSLYWESVGFMIAVGVKTKQQGLMSVQGPQKIIGRALGIRSDGRSFAVNADLPWVWTIEGYQWQVVAMARLDTFLNEICYCAERNGDVIICPYHRELNKEWAEEDLAVTEKTPDAIFQDKFPLASRHSGPAEMLRVMNRDYPWCRHDLISNRWTCILCGGFRDAYENNSSYRNQFILQHSRCGFEEARPYVPQPTEDKVIQRLLYEIEASDVSGKGTAYQVVRNLMGKVIVDEEKLLRGGEKS